MSKTMEEVWKDISLSCFHDQTTTDHHHSNNNNNTTTTTTGGLSGIILQDLFPQPDNNIHLFSPHTTTKQQHSSNYHRYQSPTTLLTLTASGGGGTISDEFIKDSSSQRQQQYLTQNHLVFHPHPQVVVSDNGNVKEKKRCRTTISDSPDRLRKRMIKNRESAERSRARKQAYTDGLEVEVDNLMKENHRLKGELKKLSLVAAAQLLKRPMLHKTSSAPF